MTRVRPAHRPVRESGDSLPIARPARLRAHPPRALREGAAVAAHQRRPCFSDATSVVEQPANGSTTTSPGFDDASMMRS